MIKEEILNFIFQFTNGNREQVIDTFTSGCCYWFAVILSERFNNQYPEIVYDVVENHFATAIRGRIYDITGDVTDQYTWIDWNTYDDDVHKKRIIKQCVKF